MSIRDPEYIIEAKRRKIIEKKRMNRLGNNRGHIFVTK